MGEEHCAQKRGHQDQRHQFEREDVFAEKEAAALPKGQLVVIEGSGHPVPMDRPVELEAAVRKFLRD